VCPTQTPTVVGKVARATWDAPATRNKHSVACIVVVEELKLCCQGAARVLQALVLPQCSHNAIPTRRMLTSGVLKWGVCFVTRPAGVRKKDPPH